MDATAQSTAPQIIIYSTAWCAFCKTEKQYLDKLNIPYVEKDIEEDKAAYEELMRKSSETGYQGVPVTDIAGTMVLGFDRRKIDELIKEKNITPVTA